MTGERHTFHFPGLPCSRRGRAFLQIPGPTNIPDRVLRAMDRPVVDHRSPEFAATDRGRPRWAAAGVRHARRRADALPGLGHRRHRSRAGQRARARRPRAGLQLRRLQRRHGHHRPQVRLRGRRGRRCAGARRSRQTTSSGGCSADSPTNPYRAVLVVHNETSTGVTVRHRRDPPGDGRRRPRRAADRRYGQLAGQHRLPHGRVARRRRRSAAARRG